MDRQIAPDVQRAARRRRLLRATVPVVVLIAVLVWLPAWIRPSVSRARIRTAPVTIGAVDAVIMASGTVAPEVERVLSSPLDARVLRILQRPGAGLRPGDPVLELDVSESVLALEKVVKDLRIKENQQAQTRLSLERSLVDLDGRIEVKALDLESARARLEADEALFRDNLLAREALRRTELAVRQTEIELAQLGSERLNAERASTVQLQGLALEQDALRKEAVQARRLLELSTTKSDRDGVLTWVVVEEGALVRRGDVIARIADLSSYRIAASVSDIHAGRVRTGMPARVRAHEIDLEGRVSEVFPTVENGVLQFTVLLADPSHPGLRPNLRADVLVITDTRPGTVRVKRGPFADNSPRAAFVVRGDSAVRMPIALGLLGADDVEVVSGLSEGDEVVISDMSEYMHLTDVAIR